MIEKDLRALLPLWAVCAIGLLATALDLPLPIRGAAAAVYIVSCATLGAYAFGHEYVHGTMPSLLAQPIARSRIYLAKLGVLALLLAALRSLLFVVPFPEGQTVLGSLIVPLPILAALFVAPWLTLVTRMPLAGAMFSMSLAAIVLLTAEWLALGQYGMSAQVNPFKVAFIRWAMLALCAVGAVMGWRTFERLEEVEGPGRPLLRSAARDTATTERTFVRRSPTWLLVKKELRLQQMALVVSAMFVGFYLFIALSRSDAIQLIVAVNIIVASLIVGSLASAEERHLGTLDGQLLLPMPVARQWVVKVAVLVGLTLCMTVVLPLTLVWLVPPDPVRLYRSELPSLAMTAIVSVVCLTAGVYVSSLMSSGLRALVTSLPALLAGITFTRLVGTPGQAGAGMLATLSVDTRENLLLAALGAFLVGVLSLALSNHRTPDRGWKRVSIQAAAIAAGLTLVVATAQMLGLL